MNTPQDEEFAMCKALHDAIKDAVIGMLALAEQKLGRGRTASVLVLTVSDAVCEVCKTPHVSMSVLGDLQHSLLKGSDPNQILNSAQALVASCGADSARKH